MCGIVGFIGHSLGDEHVRRAIDALHHRGPDEAGVYLDPDDAIGLGHARLAIIDLATGTQPLFSEDQDLALVCNGEIYDFERIRTELQLKGHRFASGSDSEVILHLYQEHGLDFMLHLRGEFAFLLYDKKAGRTLAVRDRFGIKPLYYSCDDGKYLFGSEAKALFATGALNPRIDVGSLRDCLSATMPGSIFEGINVVPPGCLFAVDMKRKTHEIVRYWDLDLDTEEAPADEQDLARDVNAVRDAVEEAVRLRMRADVPVGVYLSGGIDSAIIAAASARYCSGKLKAFTISFPEDDTFNEYAMAKRMAEKIGAEFHSVTCDHETLIRNMEDSLWATELPFVNFHGVGKFLVSALAREHVTVVLTGEGSDEVFLGYAVFQPGTAYNHGHLQKKPRHRKPPKGPHLKRIVDALGFVPLPETAAAYSAAYQRVLRLLFARPHRAELKGSHPLDRLQQVLDRNQTDGLPWVRRIQYLWIKCMLAPYLLTMLGDRSEMAHSIEGRTPFLDHVLFERASRIPDAFKIHDGTEKHVLREAFREDVTEEIYERKKWPYMAPPLWVVKGRSKALDEIIDKHLNRHAVATSGIFNPLAIRLVQWMLRLLFFDCDLRRGLNAVIVFVLTVQILDRSYVQDFEASLRSRTSRRAKRPTTAEATHGDGEIDVVGEGTAHESHAHVTCRCSGHGTMENSG